MNEFGNMMRDYRRNAGYTQRELAEQVGVDFTYISKLENGRYTIPPSEQTVWKIASVIGCDSHLLMRMSGRVVKVPIAEHDSLQELAEVGRLLSELPIGVSIKSTRYLGWSIEVYSKDNGNWYYQGCADTLLDLLRRFYSPSGWQWYLGEVDVKQIAEVGK